RTLPVRPLLSAPRLAARRAGPSGASRRHSGLGGAPPRAREVPRRSRRARGLARGARPAARARLARERPRARGDPHPRGASGRTRRTPGSGGAGRGDRRASGRTPSRAAGDAPRPHARLRGGVDSKRAGSTRRESHARGTLARTHAPGPLEEAPALARRAGARLTLISRRRFLYSPDLGARGSI